MAEPIRLNKLLASRGLCSRREADRAIQAGRVRVDGALVTEPGRRYPASVTIDLQPDEKAAVLPAAVLLHKPVGLRSEQGDLLPLVRRTCGSQLAAVLAQYAVAGRLDRDSSGLVVLARDGRIARAITSGGHWAKTYQVRTAPRLDRQVARQLMALRELDGEPLRPMHIEAPELWVLHQGRKHQIRRCCQRFGLRVLSLHRTAIGPFELGRLAPGQWRQLSGLDPSVL